ncbi:uncharacterized protein LOC107047953 [Diachasma alloeum]|uniref:uncharacterized protein LOC107047953 n=1 Tax=Diachasma alloeum TaxID=454923 RepID=UPI0007383FC6|nr:uncharacterized protein LOC107047953 [Diachasma alloeum]
MKVSGGLTSGRGINNEGVVARWILGMPAAYEVIDAFETFCEVRASTVEQHTDWRPTSIRRDTEDYLQLMKWLIAHDPFVLTSGQELMSIADGLCAGEGVNCDRARAIGMEAMRGMIGMNAGDIKLKRSTRVKSLAATKRGIVINNEVVAVNTTLLFQRIAAIITEDNQLAIRSLNHELAPFPPSLFDDNGIMRKSKKSELYAAFDEQPMSSIELSQFFEKDMPVVLVQAKFLSNDKNKERLIDFLRVHLTSAGIAVKQALEDADRLIATTAIE